MAVLIFSQQAAIICLDILNLLDVLLYKRYVCCEKGIKFSILFLSFEVLKNQDVISSVIAANEWGEKESFGTATSAMPIMLTTEYDRYLCGTSVVSR
jgi:hypothetical protein